MHNLAHTFAHSALRGAGWASGRNIEHFVRSEFGMPAVIGLVILALVFGRRR